MARLHRNFSLVAIITIATASLAASESIGTDKPGSSVDRTFRYSADLTRDGRNEAVVYTVRGAAMNRPFNWALSISDDRNRVLFKATRDDSSIDEFFADTNYMSGCANYEACKRLYYLEQIPRHISDCLKPGHTKKLAARLGFDNSSEATRYYLRERKVAPVAIDAALRELEVVLNAQQTSSFCFSYHPEDHGQFLVWLDAVKDFVPYYSP